MPKRALAICAHPDDIEFMMAGTLLLLGKAGYEIHYMTVANGCCGSVHYTRGKLAEMRRKESMAAARLAGAVFHESLVNDLEVFYDSKTLARLSAIVREIAPEIILTHYPEDYMEDHATTCRLAVMAAFTKGMPNFRTSPSRKAIDQDITLYHCPPHGLRSQLRKLIVPEIYVDIASVMDVKKAMLAEHRSQKDWLDKSQGLGSYVNTMVDLCREMGRLSKKFELAEGWVKHLHMGMSSQDSDPLAHALGKLVISSPK